MKNELKIPKRKRNHANPFSYRKEIIFNSFGNNKPIIIDIGSYRGEFGEKILKKFGQEKNFIFFEIRKPFYEYLKEYFVSYENVKVFDGDAGFALEQILDKNQNLNIEKIFINFPDPWFKKKHQKRRVVNRQFLEKLEVLLPNQTEIIFQTDQKSLFKDTFADVLKNNKFGIELFDNSPWGITTHWEDMKIKEGNRIYRMSFSKDKKNTIFERIFFWLKYFLSLF